LSVTYDDAVNAVRAFAAVMAENKAYLTELDSAIGDADHGINMDRGFQAVVGKLDGVAPGDIGAMFKTVGMTLVSTVGGAGGPLYGTLFLQLGVTTAGKSELSAEDWLAALTAAITGVQARGKAEPNDKTMLDTLMPAREALAEALTEGASFSEALQRSAAAGHDPACGAQGTRQLPGRAQRRAPGPGVHVVVPTTEDVRRHLGRRLDRHHDARRRQQMADYVGALDQGTTSTRFMIFDHAGAVKGLDQKEHEQIFPKPGWVEHDPKEIWTRSQEVIDGALKNAGIGASDLAAVGITNQRETTVVWDRATGEPVYNALVWQDTRQQDLVDKIADGDQDRFRAKTGLPLATYFSGTKVRWILDNVDGARARAEAGELAFGNIDAWCIWNLTGGTNGGVHVTDVSNASRTMLMDLSTLDWDDDLCAAIGVPRSMLPEIRPSSAVYGEAVGTLAGIPVSGDLGDQQAATFGQAAYDVGDAKNTYGTGNFMLLNTGTEQVASKSGLLTTVGWKLGDAPAVYCLEGAIAVTGSLVQWLRDNLGLISTSEEVETLANTVEDNGGIYFVPAFSGLFAPYWRGDARGAIVGMTRYVNKGHFARAALEATAWQTREVLDAMEQDSGVKLKELKVDGGMVYDDTLMQFQADCLQVPVIRPKVAETTALGAAYAAGLAVGFWKSYDDLRTNWGKDKEWTPNMSADEVASQYAQWKKAVTKTFDWV
jgi:glycerol kinase